MLPLPISDMFGNIFTPCYKVENYIAFVLPETKAKILIFCGSVVNNLDPCWDFGVL
jgi:hypothetical protein